jgi:hypothetical protein
MYPVHRFETRGMVLASYLFLGTPMLMEEQMDHSFQHGSSFLPSDIVFMQVMASPLFPAGLGE